jgi:hypothetical protein
MRAAAPGCLTAGTSHASGKRLGPDRRTVPGVVTVARAGSGANAGHRVAALFAQRVGLWLRLARARARSQALEAQRGRRAGDDHGDVGCERGERAERLGGLAEAGCHAEVGGGGDCRHGDRDPTPELARVSKASMPATPAATAATI